MFLLVASTVSCIPTKKLTYLQENNRSQTDSIVSLQLQQRPYRVQIGDVLSIRVKALDQQLVAFFNPTSSTEGTTIGEGYDYDGFVIDSRGDIRVPELGAIKVLGKTTEEIQKIIEDRLLAEYLKEESDLFVTVKILQIRYTMVGEVGSPGVVTDGSERLTVMQAVANAGDINLTGDRTDVVIIRQYPGGQKVHHIDLTSIDAMSSPYYYVQPNDMIVVNPLPQKSIGAGTTGISSFTTLLSVFTALTTVILIFAR